MHPHTADLMVTHHIDAIMGEASRSRLARTGTRSPRRGWRERVQQAIRRANPRRGLGTVARQA